MNHLSWPNLIGTIKKLPAGENIYHQPIFWSRNYDPKFGYHTYTKTEMQFTPYATHEAALKKINDFPAVFVKRMFQHMPAPDIEPYLSNAQASLLLNNFASATLIYADYQTDIALALKTERETRTSLRIVLNLSKHFKTDKAAREFQLFTNNHVALPRTYVSNYIHAYQVGNEYIEQDYAWTLIDHK